MEGSDRGFRHFLARCLFVLTACCLILCSGHSIADELSFVYKDGSPWQPWDEGYDVQFDTGTQLPAGASAGCSEGTYTAKKTTPVNSSVTDNPPGYCYIMDSTKFPPDIPAGCDPYWNGASFVSRQNPTTTYETSTMSGSRCTVRTTCGKQISAMDIGFTDGGKLFSCGAFCAAQQQACTDDLRASGIGQVRQSLLPKLDYSDQSPCGRFSRLDQMCTASCARSAGKAGFNSDQCAADCTRLHAETEQVCKPKDKAVINPVPSSVVVGTGLVQPEQKPSEPMGKPGDHPIVGGKATSALIAPCASFKRVEAMCTSFCEQAPAEDRKKCTQDCQALSANSDVIRACGGREAGSIVKDKRAKMNSQGESKSTGAPGAPSGRQALPPNPCRDSDSCKSGLTQAKNGSKPNNLDKFDGLGPNYVGQAGSTSVRGGAGQSGSTAARGGGASQSGSTAISGGGVSQSGSNSMSGVTSTKPTFQAISPSVMDKPK